MSTFTHTHMSIMARISMSRRRELESRITHRMGGTETTTLSKRTVKLPESKACWADVKVQLESSLPALSVFHESSFSWTQKYGSEAALGLIAQMPGLFPKPYAAYAWTQVWARFAEELSHTTSDSMISRRITAR